MAVNPDLYAALPPDKKEEYKKMFPEPIIDYDITSSILIDGRVPLGYAVFGDQVIKLPEAQTCAPNESEPLDLEKIKVSMKDIIETHLDSLMKPNGIYLNEIVDDLRRESRKKQFEESLDNELKKSEERDFLHRIWFSL